MKCGFRWFDIGAVVAAFYETVFEAEGLHTRPCVVSGRRPRHLQATLAEQPSSAKIRKKNSATRCNGSRFGGGFGPGGGSVRVRFGRAAAQALDAARVRAREGAMPTREVRDRLGRRGSV